MATALPSTISSICSILIHVCSLFLCGSLIYWARPGSSLFSWHPALMALAFILCMTQGISLFSSTKFTIKATTYPERVNIHKLLQILANLLALLGVSAIVANKYRNNANHLVSYHAWFGLTAMILILIQTFGGLRLLNEMPIIPYNSKIFHIALGLCTYLAGMTTIYLAFYSNWVVHIINLKIVIIFKSATIVLVVLVVSNVIQRMKKKSKPSQN